MMKRITLLSRTIAVAALCVAGAGKAAGGVEPAARAPDGAERVVIGEYIREHVKPLQDCYEQRLAADANRKTPGATLSGKLIIRFDIQFDGKVSDATAAGMSDKALVDCVVAATEKWKFEPPAAGAKLRVAYPISFQPD
jgi:TonB family protein